MADLRHPSRKLTFSDGLAVGLLLCAAALSAYVTLSRDAGTVCTVTYGSASETFSLSDDRTIPVLSNGHALTVTITNGAVSVPLFTQTPSGQSDTVTETDCPDGVCVNSGTISRAGQAIVCVPAQVTVRVDGSRPDDADAIAGGVS